MEGIARHYDKVILTLIMCLAILFMATFTPLAEYANAVAIVDDAIIAILIAGLAAVGITFVVTGAFDNLADYVESLLVEYATSQGTSTQALLKGCQSGSNKLGQILLNNRFVVLISTFGAWLKAKFSLQDNTTTVAQAQGASLDNYQLYGLPLTIEATNSQYNDVVYEIYIATAPVYLLFGLDGSTLRTNMLSNEAATVRVYGIKSNGQIDGDRNFVLSYNNEYGLYYTNRGMTYNQYHDFSHITIYNQSDVITALEGNGDIDYNNIGIDIVTGDVILPLDDENYTDGDGAVIDLDNSWGTTYTDIVDDVIPDEFSDSKEGSANIEYVSEEEVTEQVEDTQETTNLPAGTIPFAPSELPEITLSSIWHYVAQWISDTAIAAGSLMAIVTQSPSPMVNLFYATICLAIIFGIVKGFAK